MCFVDYCDRVERGRTGLCENHYARRGRGELEWWLPSQKEKSGEERFLGKVNKLGGFADFSDPRVRIGPEDGECWIWTGTASKGYGSLRHQSVDHKAYRFSYELYVGPIPSGLQIDHLCRRTLCVHPRHLEPVTPRENRIRAVLPECKRGHEYIEGSFYLKKNGSRQCKECNLIGARERRAH